MCLEEEEEDEEAKDVHLETILYVCDAIAQTRPARPPAPLEGIFVGMERRKPGGG